MPGFTTLNVAISGLRAAQTGLAVTGHNMANAEIAGFSRQRSIQSESPSRSLGVSRAGQTLQVGIGTDNGAIHHIRSRYFDLIYRQHNARLNFYATKTAIGHHIETVLGETETSFRMQTVLSDMWNSFHELNMSLGGLETREFFIGTIQTFMDKAHNVFDELFEFQQNLDGQIRNMVTEINDIVAEINRLNVEIHANELAGDNANDMRDDRHRLLDRLSGLIPMDYFEDPRTSRIDITTINGNFLLSKGTQNTLGLLQISGRYSFVEPVFTRELGTVLHPNTPPRMYEPLFSWDRPIDSVNNNDEGALMALLQARGAMPATYRGIEALWTPVQPHTRPYATAAWQTAWAAAPNPSTFDLPADLQTLMAEWQLYHDYLMGLPDVMVNGVATPQHGGIIPPNPATFPGLAGTPPDPTPEELAAFVGAIGIYRLERQNDINNFEALFPLSASDASGGSAANRDAFLAAVHGLPALDPLDPGYADAVAARTADYRRMMDSYRAASRTYRQAAWSKQHALIPRVQKQMDQIVNSVVRLINGHLAPVTDHQRCPDAPFDLHEARSFTEVFVRQQHARFNGDHIHNPGFGGDMDSLYTTRNLVINPALLESGGYNLLALSLSGDREDTRVIQSIIDFWGQNDGPYSIVVGGQSLSIDRAYHVFITDLAIEVREAETFMGSQFHQVSQADFRRNAIAGVSLDEETSNMLTFQFAYQAAARLFNIIDSMIETVINIRR